MPVETFIQASERSMLSYVLKPPAEQASHAFRVN